MNKSIVLLAGLGSVVFGFSIIIKPDFYDRLYDFYWDFTEVKWLFGLFLVVFGVLIIWSALRKKAKDYEDKVLICPKCKEPFNRKDVPGERCPKCEVQLEDLEGFYARHPELKTEQNRGSKTEQRN